MEENNSFKIERIVQEFSEEAKEDYIGLWQIIRQIHRLGVQDSALLEPSLRVVICLLNRGLQAGNLPKEGGFVPWDDQTPASVITRIRREWIELGRTPRMWEIVWFSLPK